MSVGLVQRQLHPPSVAGDFSTCLQWRRRREESPARRHEWVQTWFILHHDGDGNESLHFNPSQACPRRCLRRSLRSQHTLAAFIGSDHGIARSAWEWKCPHRSWACLLSWCLSWRTKPKIKSAIARPTYIQPKLQEQQQIIPSLKPNDGVKVRGKSVPKPPPEKTSMVRKKHWTTT